MDKSTAPLGPPVPHSFDKGLCYLEFTLTMRAMPNFLHMIFIFHKYGLVFFDILLHLVVDSALIFLFWQKIENPLTTEGIKGLKNFFSSLEPSEGRHPLAKLQ